MKNISYRLCFRTAMGRFGLVAALALAFGAMGAKPSSAGEDDPCYANVVVTTEPAGAHIYFDQTGEEWFSKNGTAEGRIYCSRSDLRSGSDRCAFGFTGKKAGYKATSHIVRITGDCDFSYAAKFRTLRFTIVLDPQ